MKELQELAMSALGGEVICIAHISTIIEGLDWGQELSDTDLIAAKLFDIYDEYVKVDECYGKNTLGGCNSFFTVDTPLGKIAYVTDNYPFMFIKK